MSDPKMLEINLQTAGQSLDFSLMQIETKGNLVPPGSNLDTHMVGLQSSTIRCLTDVIEALLAMQEMPVYLRLAWKAQLDRTRRLTKFGSTPRWGR